MNDLETRLQRAARDFPYPETPDLTGAVRERLTERAARPAFSWQRLAWTSVVLLVLIAGLLAVPQVRAAVLRVLRLGAVEIIVEPTPTATPAARTVTPLESVLDLAGETTLAGARAQVGFTIRLPTRPPDLGPPDRVFVQDLDGPAVVLVWLEPGRPGRVRLSLHQLRSPALVRKLQPRTITATTVNGADALWTEGPYLLYTRGGHLESQRLIQGQVLIWTEGRVTYRLETDLPLEEAVRVAESLR